MDFNLKKLVNDAGGLFNRARQLTEEKLLNAERTEIDPQLEQLLQRVDATEFHMTKLYSALETYLQPNPGLFAFFKLFECPPFFFNLIFLVGFNVFGFDFEFLSPTTFSLFLSGSCW